MSNLLIFKVPFIFSKEQGDEIIDELIEQREKGIIIVPSKYEVIIVENDTNIRVDSKVNGCGGFQYE